MKNILTIIILLIALVATLWVLGGKTVGTDDTHSSSVGSLSGTVLDMSNQGLTKVAVTLFERADVVELDLSHNKLEGALPSQVGKLQNESSPISQYKGF
jgi:hypothetical protein